MSYSKRKALTNNHDAISHAHVFTQHRTDDVSLSKSNKSTVT